MFRQSKLFTNRSTPVILKPNKHNINLYELTASKQPIRIMKIWDKSLNKSESEKVLINETIKNENEVEDTEYNTLSKKKRFRIVYKSGYFNNFEKFETIVKMKLFYCRESRKD